MIPESPVLTSYPSQELAVSRLYPDGPAKSQRSASDISPYNKLKVSSMMFADFVTGLENTT